MIKPSLSETMWSFGVLRAGLWICVQIAAVCAFIGARKLLGPGIFPGLFGLALGLSLLYGLRRWSASRPAAGAPLKNPTHKTPWILFIIGLTIRLTWWVQDVAPPNGDFRLYLEFAHHWVESGDFVGTAGRAVGVPAILAVLEYVGLDPKVSFRLLNALMSAGIAPMLYYACRSFGRATLGVAAAAIWVFLPSATMMTSFVGTETISAFGFLGVLILIARMESEPRWRWAVAAGLLSGSLAYCRSEFLLFWLGAFLLCVCGGVFVQRRRRMVTRYALALALTYVCMVPWGIRNQIEYGHFWTSTSNTGIALYMAFNEVSTGTHLNCEDWPQPVEGCARLWGKSFIPNKAEVDQLLKRRAWEYVISNPIRALTLTPKKWYHLYKDDWVLSKLSFWDNPRIQPREGFYIKAVEWSYLLLMLAAWVGVWRLGHWPGSLLIPVALGVMYKTTLHSIFHAETRYHLLILPLFCLLAANAFVSSRSSGTNGSLSARTRTRRVRRPDSARIRTSNTKDKTAVNSTQV